jgi:hypothetical protein
MSRRENGFYIRQMGLDRLAQRESIRGLGEDFRDQNVAPAVLVDPFDGIVGICGGSRQWPAEVAEFCREGFRRGSGAVNNQYFHWASCLR